MKLFYMPHACSYGIHALLEEIGKPYETELVDLYSGVQYQPPFVGMNPKSKVPTLLREDGRVITEFPVIAYYLAKANPELNLLPAELDAEVQTMEWTDYMISSLHMRGFSRVFRPQMFSPLPEGEAAVAAEGRKILEHGFALLAGEMGDKPYLMGEISIADFALLVLEFWGRMRAKMPMPAALEAHLDRMLARPAVQAALKAEGMI